MVERKVLTLFIDNIGEIFVEEYNKHIIESSTWILRNGFIYGETGLYGGQYFHLILGEQMYLPEARRLKAAGLKYFFATDAGEFESWGDAVKSLDNECIKAIGFISECRTELMHISGIGDILIDAQDMDIVERFSWVLNNGYIQNPDGLHLNCIIADRMGFSGLVDFRDLNTANNQRSNIYEIGEPDA